MARYIDAELALKLKDEKGNWVYDLYDLEAYLVGVPTADVQEVKHGEWVDSENGGYVCSVCNCWMEDYYGSTPEQLQYCFKCGAKMDGGNNE